MSDVVDVGVDDFGFVIVVVCLSSRTDLVVVVSSRTDPDDDVVDVAVTLFTALGIVEIEQIIVAVVVVVGARRRRNKTK